jgi:uncharacterized lipoprotein YajG
MTAVRLFGLTFASIWLAACSTVVVPVTYTAPATVVKRDLPVVTIGQFADKRNEEPTYIGAVRGGFGNKLKTITTSEPVADLVAHAFEHGLAARGLKAPGASSRYALTGVVNTLQSNRYVRIDAEADVLLRLIDTRGVQVFEKNYHAEIENGTIVALDTGVFADPDELRSAAAQVLAKVVDQALDDPDFLRALSN